MDGQLNYRELLEKKLKNDLYRENQQNNKIRGLLESNDKIAELDPSLRTDYTAGLNFVDQMTGGNNARAYKAPESTQDALRSALNARLRSPKSNPLQSLQLLVQSDAAKTKASSFDKESQRQREALLKTKEGQAVIRDKKLQEKASRYQELVNKHGYTVTGPARAELDGAYRELQIAYKNAAELGVIAGPDMMLIEGIAPPSTGIAGMFQNQIKGGQAGVNRALDQLKKSRQSDIAQNEDVLRQVFPGSATDTVFKHMFSNSQGNNSSNQNSPEIFKNMSDEDLQKFINGGQ